MQKKKKKSKIIILVIVGILLAAVIIAILDSKFSQKGIEVEVAKAKRTTITEKISASGTVQPVTEVKLAPEVSGEIIELHVKDGDVVKAGQLLVKIRPDIWISQMERSEALLNQQYANVESAKAALLKMQATYIRAEAEYHRQKKLWDQHVIAESEWQVAEQNFKIAQNDVKTAEQSLEASKFLASSTQASVQESRANVNKTSVLAPMDGVVSQLLVKKGERVVGAATMTGTEMMRIANLNDMEVLVNVNENDIVRIHKGDSVIIDVDAYSATDRKFKGIVTNIANTARTKTSTDAITEFEVHCSILPSCYQDMVQAGNKYPFRPGLTATVEIISETKDNTLAVPLSAVTTRPPLDKPTEQERGDNNDKPQVVDISKAKAPEKKDLLVVFLKEKDGKCKMQEVKTGISDYDNIEIVSGITDSATVIVGPFMTVSKLLKDGDKVTLMKKGDMPAHK